MRPLSSILFNGGEGWGEEVRKIITYLIDKIFLQEEKNRG
jgi:hypothetical protein